MAVVERPAPAQAAQMAAWVALGGRNSGIVGDGGHTYGYHRGAAFVPATDYSRRRDPRGADGPYPDWGYCCAGDYHHGGDPVLRARHAVLLTRLLDDDPTLRAVCEFIGQPWPERPVLYWFRGDALKRYTGRGHDLWSHVGMWRSDCVTPVPLWAPASAAVPAGPGTVPAQRPTVLRAPPWPPAPAFFAPSPSARYDATVRAWQARMRQRGWRIAVDGHYGPEAAEVARAFQREKGLRVDGLLGPATFAAAWSSPVT